VWLGRQKTLKMSLLDPTEVNLCHLAIVILKFMNPDWMVQVAMVLSVPNFKFIKLARRRNQDPERTPHIFNRIIGIHLFFKAEFLQLDIINGNGVQVIDLKPVILISIVNAYLPVFMIDFSYLSVEAFSPKICLDNVTLLNILNPDHIDFLRI
jgi:hypothetical protein